MPERRTTKPRVFMAVYGVLACDGRVLRAARALAEVSDLVLLGIASPLKCESLPCAVLEVPLSRFRRWGRVRMLLFWFTLLWHAIRTRPAVVYAHDYSLLAPGWLASRIARARLVYDAHELIVPDRGQSLSVNRRIVYSLERLLIRRVDLLVAANDDRAAIMKVHYGLRQRPIVIHNIPPCPRGTQQGSAGGHTGLAPARGTTRLLYQGMMGLDRELVLFVRVLSHLEDQYELVMVGDGPEMGALRNVAREEGVISRVTFLGQVPIRELPSITRQCSVGIVSYSFDTLNQRYCAPNKVYEYAQAGVPIVATGQDVLQELVAGTGIGAILPRGANLGETLEQYAATIRYVAQHRDQFIARIPEFLEENSWEVEKAKLKRAFDGLLQRQERSRCRRVKGIIKKARRCLKMGAIRAPAAPSLRPSQPRRA
jgi:glycosyltransferase involved in cell wall biosynthesis